MEEIGFKEGELDDIIFMRLKPKESISRYKMKLQLAAVDFCQRELDEFQKSCPNYVPDENDAPVLSPYVLYMLDCEKLWKTIESIPKEKRWRMVYEKASPAYRAAMEKTAAIDLLD